MERYDRRAFMARTTALGTLAGLAAGEGSGAENRLETTEMDTVAARRRELWELLGDLPKADPPEVKVLRTTQHECFRIEHLEMAVNGVQPAPALLLLPDKIKTSAPAMLYLHWHGGDYAVGKQELLQGTRVMAPYAEEYARRGMVVLAMDSWCFGERMPYPDDGGVGESDTFKEMLWQGKVLFGMMLFDEWQGLNYLCSRPEVDPKRIGAFGISMGATKAWWLTALDERIRCCIDLCCLTDYEALIKTKNLRAHGIYYYVPRLLKHFSSAQINALIAPRPRLSLNGRQDKLTPPEGVERIREKVMPLYKAAGAEKACHIALYDCGHEELPEMRSLVLQWMDEYLINDSGDA